MKTTTITKPNWFKCCSSVMPTLSVKLCQAHDSLKPGVIEHKRQRERINRYEVTLQCIDHSFYWKIQESLNKNYVFIKSKIQHSVISHY